MMIILQILKRVSVFIMKLLFLAKMLFDWSILNEILGDHQLLSDAMNRRIQ